ncbi:MAG TPA: LysR family transcriptional regulator [Opitutus sp.]|nr:LysR family transcriptional regulator [Opitutus sp.]
MELRHLRYFVAVAEALSYRGAAERLHVAQPALSKQIQDLEAEVGARLLNRNTGGVSLTDAGAVLLDEARDILERVEMAAAAARDAASGKGGRLTIGSLGAVSASFLPASLAAFRERFPGVEINLHESTMPEQITELRRGVIQLGFAIEQAVEIPPDLETLEIQTVRMAVALGPEHRFAGKSKVSLAELAHEPLLCVGIADRYDLHRKMIESVFDARGIRHRPLKRVNGLESLVALIAGGHGVSLLLPFPLSGRKREIAFKRVAEDGDDLAVRMLAVWRARDGSKLAQNFVEVLRAQRRAAR